MAAVVALAAAVGSTLSFAVTAWLRHRERPNADWAVNMNGDGYFRNPYGWGDGYHLAGHISNAGDGDAFRVRLEATNCEGSLDAPKTGGRVALLRPGDEIGFWITVPLGGWDSASVEIVWIEPPTRLQKEGRVPLHPRLHMERPEITEEVTDAETGMVSRVPITVFQRT